jgi:hypothetical protein
MQMMKKWQVIFRIRSGQVSGETRRNSIPKLRDETRNATSGEEQKEGERKENGIFAACDDYSNPHPPVGVK